MEYIINVDISGHILKKKGGEHRVFPLSKKKRKTVSEPLA